MFVELHGSFLETLKQQIIVVSLALHAIGPFVLPSSMVLDFIFVDRRKDLKFNS